MVQVEYIKDGAIESLPKFADQVWYGLLKTMPDLCKAHYFRKVEDGQKKSFWERIRYEGKLIHNVGGYLIDVDNTKGIRITPFVGEPIKEKPSMSLGKVTDEGEGMYGCAYVVYRGRQYGYIEMTKFNDDSMIFALDVAKQHKFNPLEITLSRHWNSVNVSEPKEN
jgi:hypothetical protein